MRIRDRDRRCPASSLDLRHGLVGAERHQVPEDVPGRRLDEQRALANRKLGLDSDAEQSRLLLA